MQLSGYKFTILKNNNSFIIAKSKYFFMNKITYHDFAEKYDSDLIKNEFELYFYSMIYIFKLIIPNEENFILAKSIGFIDSNKIDWIFWKNNVIKRSLPEEFMLKHCFVLLKKLKNTYYNFFQILLPIIIENRYMNRYLLFLTLQLSYLLLRVLFKFYKQQMLYHLYLENI